eukprot:TRINITY_DN36867_c0_g1_i1.p1 TRINITY_DN36867_c0_g1~~TRINITY_DN36867_c0_g1_i1.p1  ORF type:complete len:843 (+),score=178.10 TRINITY_DN36867_c0_g1_i1:123-2651(+)
MRRLYAAWASRERDKNPFSFERLQQLYQTLVKHPVITDANRDLIVETLRATAELIIWGEQNGKNYFDFFLEKNILGYFLKILGQKTNKQVKVQLIQTLSILIQNITSETSVYYLLSNNHINDLIVHKFDFSDEEVLAYYISFLKTLSLKLNINTVQFFFNERANDFPLYTEAIKFFNHEEPMIRIAVRTLTLNIFRVQDKAVRRFILDRTAAPYFSNLAWFIRNQCIQLTDQLFNERRKMTPAIGLARLEQGTSELMDHFYYLHDIFCLRLDKLSKVLSDQMLRNMFMPQLVASLLESNEPKEGFLNPLLAMFLLAQTFAIFTFRPLLNSLAMAILQPGYVAHITENNGNTPKGESFPKNETDDSKSSDRTPTNGAHGRGGMDGENPFREAVLCAFRSNDDRSLLVSCAFLFSVMTNRNVDRTILREAFILPWRRLNTRRYDSDEDDWRKKQDPFGQGEMHSVPAEDMVYLPKSRSAVDLSANDSGGNVKTRERPVSIATSNDVGSEVQRMKSSRDEGEEEPAEENDEILDPVMGSPHAHSEGEASESENEDDVPHERLFLIVDGVLSILERHARCRLVTLQLATQLLNEYVGEYALEGPRLERLKRVYDGLVISLRERFRGPYTDFFLDVFENECQQITRVRLEGLVTDSSLLLEVTDDAKSGLAFSKRMPCSEVEVIRKITQTFLMFRLLLTKVTHSVDDKLPLPSRQPSIKEQEEVELASRKTISCVVHANNQKLKRCLVVDPFFLIITEASSSRHGWGVARLVVPLLRVESTIDKFDPRALQVAIRSPLPPDAAPPTVWLVRMLFEDQSHTIEAKTYLDGGRGAMREEKIMHIASVLD